MKIVFISNYMNHHQLPIAKELFAMLGEQYVFIQMEPVDQERIRMGWEADFSSFSFIKYYYKEPILCQTRIDEADVVVLGNEKNIPCMEKRILQKKPFIRYTERIYKEGQWRAISPKGLIQKYKEHTRYRKDPFYLLCAGAYVASDFSLIHAYKGKKYVWGYFPETISHETDTLFNKKKHTKTQILWAGRFIDWKHPEYAVEVAHRLAELGYDFELTMVGDGELRASLEEKIKAYELSSKVNLLGFKTPLEVREIMEEANIFLFTSDYNEGWGAVLNEAMNAGCAVVANCAIGSVPTLLKPGENGLLYKNKDFREFEKQVIRLIKDESMCKKLGEAAYLSIETKWSHHIAAKRLVQFCREILKGDPSSYVSGPLSIAKAIKPRKMYHLLQEGKNK